MSGSTKKVEKGSISAFFAGNYVCVCVCVRARVCMCPFPQKQRGEAKISAVIAGRFLVRYRSVFLNSRKRDQLFGNSFAR
jgi:hypothetical protein